MGIVNVKDMGGFTMCLSIVDEASREVFIFLEKEKTAEQILKDIKSCVQLVEARTRNKLKSFQRDRGSEFHNNIQLQ